MGRSGVDQVDRDLGVVDLAAGAGVLALHAHRGRALLAIARLVEHKHRGGVAEVVDDLVPDVITHASSSQARRLSRRSRPSRVGCPACSAMVQPILRGKLRQQPHTNAAARRRGSTRANRPATRPSSSARSACQRAGPCFCLRPPSDPLVVLTAPDDQRWPFSCANHAREQRDPHLRTAPPAQGDLRRPTSFVEVRLTARGDSDTVAPSAEAGCLCRGDRGVLSGRLRRALHQLRAGVDPGRLQRRGGARVGWVSITAGWLQNARLAQPVRR